MAFPSGSPRILAIFAAAIVLCLVAIIIGVINIAIYYHCPKDHIDKEAIGLGPFLGPNVPQKIIEDADPTINQKLINKLNKANIKNNLRYAVIYNKNN